MTNVWFTMTTGRRAVAVGGVELPAAQQGNRQGLEVARPDAEGRGPRARNVAAAGRMETRDEGVAAQRHERRDRGRLHAWNPLQSFDELIGERQTARQSVARRLEVEPGHHAVVEIEAEIHAEHAHLAAQAERRHHEQRQRHGHLTDDEGAAKIETAGRARPSPAEPGERRWLGSSEAPEWRRTRAWSTAPDTNVGPASEGRGQSHPGSDVRGSGRSARLRPDREQHAGRCAEQRQEEALGEERLHHADTAGAERRPDRELVLSRDGSRQEQAGDVDGADQEDEPEEDEKQRRQEPEPNRRAAKLQRLRRKHLGRPAAALRCARGSAAPVPLPTASPPTAHAQASRRAGVSRARSGSSCRGRSASAA